MSWFNPKAFAAGALGELNNIIDTNFEEAKTYEEEQRELFKSSKVEIGRRRSIVGGLVGVANKLSDMGVSKAAIQAAHSSGPQGLLDLQKLITTENRRRIGAAGPSGKLTEDDINAMITMGGMAEVQNPEFEKMDYKTFFEKSMNLGGGDTPEVAPQRNFLQEALGMGAKKAVTARLDAEMGGSGLSILDMNELAQRDAYNSLMPGSYADFTANPFYEPSKAMAEFTRYQSKIVNNLAMPLKYPELTRIKSASGIPAEERARLELEFVQNLYVPFVASQVQLFGAEAANDEILDYVNVVGPENLNRILLQNELPLLEQKKMERQLTRKGNIVTLPIGDTKQAILTVGPSGDIISIQTSNSNNANASRTITDPADLDLMIQDFFDKGYLTEGVLGEDISAIEIDPSEEGRRNAATNLTMGSAEQQIQQAVIDTKTFAARPEFNVELTAAQKEDLEKLRIDRELKSSEEVKEELPIISDPELALTLDALQLKIVEMAEDNPKHKALVEKFFGSDAPAPTAKTFRDFQSALVYSGTSTDERDVLSESVTRLGDLILRDGEPAFSLIGEKNSVWSLMKDTYSWMNSNAEQTLENRETDAAEKKRLEEEEAERQLEIQKVIAEELKRREEEGS